MANHTTVLLALAICDRSQFGRVVQYMLPCGQSAASKTMGVRYPEDHSHEDLRLYLTKARDIRVHYPFFMPITPLDEHCTIKRCVSGRPVEIGVVDSHQLPCTSTLIIHGRYGGVTDPDFGSKR
jgi:hypothetical protein